MNEAMKRAHYLARADRDRTTAGEVIDGTVQHLREQLAQGMDRTEVAARLMARLVDFADNEGAPPLAIPWLAAEAIARLAEKE